MTIEENINWSDKTILIVDDEDTNVEYIFLILKKKFEGINILIANDGCVAVEIYKNHDDINLVLMDIRMPLMSGIEAAKIIKSLKNNLSIISTTAYCNTEKNISNNIIFDDFIVKPINKDILIQTIQKYI